MNAAELHEAIRVATVEAVDELLDNVARKPEHRAELVDAFTRISLDIMASYVEHLAKRAAADRGLGPLEH